MRSIASISLVMLLVLTGPLVWALHFLVAYASHAASCAAGDRLPLLDVGALPLILLAATALAFGLLIAALVWAPALVRLVLPSPSPTEEDGFLVRLLRLLGILSLLALLWSSAAMLLLPICQQLR